MWILILFFGMSILSVIVYKYFPVYVTPLMIIRCYEQIKNGEKLKMKHEWKDLDKISEHMPVAVWASEDQSFIYHNGFDTKAIEQALEEREKRPEGRPVKGFPLCLRNRTSRETRKDGRSSANAVCNWFFGGHPAVQETYA